MSWPPGTVSVCHVRREVAVTRLGDAASNSHSTQLVPDAAHAGAPVARHRTAPTRPIAG